MDRLHEYAIMRTFVAGQSSPFINKRHGACIFNPKEKLVGEGWITTVTPDPRKEINDFKNVISGICNALANASETIDCTLYTNGFPTEDCVKQIVLHGIKYVCIARMPEKTTDEEYIEGILNKKKIEFRYIPIKGPTLGLIKEIGKFLKG